MMGIKLTLEEIKKRVFDEVGDEYTVLSDTYKNYTTKLLFRHNKCGNTFEMSADGFLTRKNRCKYCASQQSWAYSTEEIKNKIKLLPHGEDYELLDEYKNTHTPVRFKHLTCGNEFLMRPNNFIIKGNRCPFCPNEDSQVVGYKGGQSTGEKIIKKYLLSKNIKFEEQVSIKSLGAKTGRQRFDFKVFNSNGSFSLIEFDGRFHSEPQNKTEFAMKKYLNQKESDEIKNKFCRENNIKLVRIDYRTAYKQIYNQLDKVFNDYRN